MWALGSPASRLELHRAGCSSAPEGKPGSGGGARLRPHPSTHQAPRGRAGGRHLFLADLLIALVLKSLLHSSQRDLPVVLGGIVVEAATEGRVRESKAGVPGRVRLLTQPTQETCFWPPLASEGQHTVRTAQRRMAKQGGAVQVWWVPGYRQSHPRPRHSTPRGCPREVQMLIHTEAVHMCSQQCYSQQPKAECPPVAICAQMN